MASVFRFDFPTQQRSILFKDQLSDKVNKMKNTSCENWTLKSSEQRKWTSRYRKSNYKAYHCAVPGAVVIENFLPQFDGGRKSEENRQKKETGERFSSQKTEFWQATHLIYEQHMIDLSRYVMKYFWRRSFHGQRSIAIMILFRKAISLGLNDQYNTLSTFDKNWQITKGDLSQIISSLPDSFLFRSSFFIRF